MKRALIIILTTFAFVACSKDDVVMEYKGQVIDFRPTTGRAMRSTVYDATTFSSFRVWGYYANGSASSVMMDNVEVTKQSDGSWGYTDTKYWPVEGEIDFVGLYPTAAEVEQGLFIDHRTNENLVSISHDGFATGANRQIIVTALRESESMHFSSHLPDVIYAVTENQQKQATDVQMNFRHAMTQVKCRIKNENPDFTIEFKPDCAVEIHNIRSKGTYTLPSATTTSGDETAATRGVWSFSADDFESFDIFTAANPKIEGMTADTEYGYISTSEFMKDNTPAMFFPCQATAWDVTDGSASAQNGAYFVVHCRVLFQRGTMTQPYYLLGTATSYDSIYVPIDIDWKEGHLYTYTFAIGKGAGYTEEGDSSIVPLTFSTTIEDFEDVASTDFEL